LGGNKCGWQGAVEVVDADENLNRKKKKVDEEE
jgi:hypothetical protein